MRATTMNRPRRRWLVAALAVAGTVAAAAPADAAPFGVAPGSAAVQLLDGGGAPQGQAGAHPDLRVSFDLTTAEPDGTGAVLPTGSLKDVDVRLPPGVLGSLTATPICVDTARETLDCPSETAVGEVGVRLAQQPVIPPGPPALPMLVHRLPAPPGVAARLGFWIVNISVLIDVRVTPDGGYRLTSNVKGVSTASILFGQSLTLWGVPADHNGEGPLLTAMNRRYGGRGPGERKPFIWAPTRCGAPLDATIGLRSWQEPERTVSTETRISDGLSGCDQLPFAPTLEVRPDAPVAGQPSGYAIDLAVPQHEGPDELTTAQLRDATVTLPEGVAISPGRARGLDVCTDEQLGEGKAEAESCPPASRIGEVRIDSPLLPDPLTGVVYIGEQRSHDPASGEMYRMFLVAHDPRSGVRIKLRGQIKADPRTGQLTTTFADNPQLPFSRLSLHLDGGDHAALVNPAVCGEQRATLAATAWSGPSTTASTTFAIDQGCPSGQFAPAFVAGTTNPLAGGFSPFSMTVARTDADRPLSSLRIDLPSGLLGALGSVPLCGEAQAAAGTCGAASRIGSTTVAVGSGGAPYSLGGTVSLTGPYKGAPFGLSVAVPAKAGPFDLGLVVVRAALHVDANQARATVVTDAFPTIVGGVPIALRRINVALDRPGFIFNATRCAPTTIGGTFGSVGGAVSATSVRYQPTGCDGLKLQPTLSLRYTGRSQMREGRHPGVEAKLGAVFGQANLKAVQVKLPVTVSLDPDNAQALCEPDAAAARNCPATSIIGWASATTPSLHVPVQGPVYFVRGTRIGAKGQVIKTLPKLYLKLSGEGVSVDLRADSDVDSKKRLVTTFTNIPDVPISDFKLRINNGKHGILKATSDVCGAAKGTTVTFTGQNGGKTRRNLRFAAPDCKPQVVSATGRKNATLGVRVAGIGGGKLTLTGSGIGKATRTVRSSDTALVRARFSKATRARLRRGKTVKVALKVSYAPRKGAKTPAGKPAKKVTLKKTVKIKGD